MLTLLKKLTRRQWIVIGSVLLLAAVSTTLLIVFLRPAKPAVAPAMLAKGAPFLDQNPRWADSLLATMSLEEKVGQLIMLDFSAYADGEGIPGPDAEAGPLKPGAVCLTAGPLRQQLLLLEMLRARQRVPLLAAASAETGLLWPSDTLSRNPLLETVASVGSDSILAAWATQIAQQLKAAGIQMNFAPDLSFVAKNRDQSRDSSFTAFLHSAGSKLVMYMQRQQREGILVCAQSFPNFRSSQQQPADIFDALSAPYDTLRLGIHRMLCNAGLSAMTVTHRPQQMADSSEPRLIDSLHTAFAFGGLVVGDFSGPLVPDDRVETGMTELMSLKTGSDMVRVSAKADDVYAFILEAAKSGQLSTEELNAKVRRILLAKAWSGLAKPRIAWSDSLYDDLPRLGAEAMARRALATSFSLLANRNQWVPIRETANNRTSSLCISARRRPAFTGGLDHYAAVSHYQLNPTATAAEYQAMAAKLKTCQTLIVAVFADPALAAHAADINRFMNEQAKGKRMIVIHFGPGESLALLDRYPAMIQSFGTDKVSQAYAAQAVYGGTALASSLPFTCSQQFCYDDGLAIKHPSRLHYGIPEESGVDSEVRTRIDSVVDRAISNGAFPGCQVFVACEGNVIVNKAYGHHTYDHKKEVKTGDLYDLASVTKVAAGTLAIMALYDAGKIDLDTTLNYYFKDLDKNSKGKKVRNSKLNYITLEQLMTHRSGLPSALPIARFISPKWYLRYMMELEKKRMEEENNDTLVAEEQSPEWMVDTSSLMMAEDSIFRWLFTKEKDKEHKIQIGEEVFMRQAVVDSIWELAKQTAVRKNRDYVYSDMNFYIVMKVVEAVSKTGIDKYVADKYYRPMNLGRICYNPAKSFDKERIVPTEEEKIFRKQLIHGYVHDPTAALLGGVSGNAGLFSNAEDLGTLMQMLLNGGVYGGKRYLSEKTIQLFTSVHEPGYRGLGWDHQTRSGMKMIAPGASPATYGHTGFTGTCVWVDPVHQVVFVFLSNRVHPSNTNQRINGMRVRQKVQQAVYDAMHLPQQADSLAAAP